MSDRNSGHPIFEAQWFDPPFDIFEPDTLTAPMVFNSPHSGRIYPPEFVEGSKLDSHSLRRSEDCYVDQVFSGVVGYGAPLMRANFPRAYLDVNREAYELDPVMFADPPTRFRKYRLGQGRRRPRHDSPAWSPKPRKSTTSP